MTRIAILDDYLKLALKSADWSALPSDASVHVFHQHLGDEDAVAEALAEFEVVAAMRERTPFPARLIARMSIDRLRMPRSPCAARRCSATRPSSTPGV